jgi:hypothetical protein
MTTVRYPIRIGSRSRLFLRFWGVTPQRAFVDVDETSVHARFGFGDMTIPLANIARWRIEGPWLWITAIGIRMSVRHRDLSFAGSPHGGVRLDFRDRVRYGPFRIPALYVAVDDLEALAATLTAAGIPGEDARTRRVP